MQLRTFLTWLILTSLTVDFSVSTLAQDAANNRPTDAKPPTAQTNLASQPIEVQLQAVNKAMESYYKTNEDPVERMKTISLVESDILEDTGDQSLRINVVCFVHAPAKVPSKICLHVLSHSKDWRFLTDHDFTIRFDDQKLSPSDLDYSHKVLDDATVIEDVWPDFTVEQFRQIAWSKQVYFKLGYKNYEISPQLRQKWKLLWKYFDLIKQQQANDAAKAIGD